MIMRPNRAMSLTPLENLRWGLAYGRGLGVVVAIVLAIVWQLEVAPTLDLISVLMIVLPAMEVGLFAGVAAIYRDSVVEEENQAQAEILAQGQLRDLMQAVAAMVLWFAVVLILCWLTIIAVRASVIAYTALGVPPRFDLLL